MISRFIGEVGSVYLFNRNGSIWGPPVTEINGNVSTGGFGSSLAMSSDMALVGAPGPPDESLGTVTVLARTGAVWSVLETIDGPGTKERRSFGQSIAFSGNTAVIGAPHSDTGAGSASGNAFVFTTTGSGWIPKTRLEADDESEDDAVGTSVAIEGNTAIIGAPFDSYYPDQNHFDAPVQSGCAYIFVREGMSWGQQAHLVLKYSPFSERFGNSVAISGDTVLVGRNSNYFGVDASVFTRTAGRWSDEGDLPLPYSPRISTGPALSICGNTAMVGANGDQVVYVYERIGATWNALTSSTVSNIFLKNLLLLRFQAP